LLKCLGEEEAKVAMGEAHKMRWMLRGADFYWLKMVEDCFKYLRGCEACQRFGDIQQAPASMLHLVIKPWSFHGWGLDFIGEVRPFLSKGHRFVLVATDYFTKWTKAVPLRNLTHREVINFVTEHIIH
jgi:hypothetical protein